MHTPDPDITSDPPNQATEGRPYGVLYIKLTVFHLIYGMIICHSFVDMGFNIAWLRGGHPLLNVGDLAMEASQSLGLLLEQLKPPKIRSLSTSMIIVFVSRLALSIFISLYFSV
jgi:symplekin